eukprot:4474242-Lingulodinium_polyedra.AAC.1
MKKAAMVRDAEPLRLGGRLEGGRREEEEEEAHRERKDPAGTQEGSASKHAGKRRQRAGSTVQQARGCTERRRLSGQGCERAA